jgi:septum formation protein maf|nr:Maf family protein [uncultured Actinomyces sp.]
MRLVLASASPARRATLIAAGITPLVRVSTVNEDAVLAALPGGRAFSGTATTPADEVSALAAAKCLDVCEALARNSPDLPDGEPVLVVGCDSMLEIGGQMLGKPHTPEVARERIAAMRRTTATLWTGHCAAILAPASSTQDGDTRVVTASVTRSASTLVHFGDISDAEIDAYVATGEPLHVAGSFTVDGLGGPFIEGVTGDYHSVVGISLPLLRAMATELGVFWPDLWDAPRP